MARLSLRAIQTGGGGVLGGLARGALSALALGWGGAQVLKAAAYARGLRRSVHLPAPVLSVGNLAVGGTGKTPFTAWLVRHLRSRGRTPGVLSRGYGPRTLGGLSDEGAVLEHLLGPRLPQVEDPDRVRGGRHLLAARPDVDVLVLDDGFQHRRLARDLDVVLLDAVDPWGLGRLLPRGRLREPPAALARAGAVVLTRAERVDGPALEALSAQVARLTRAPVAVARTEPVALAVGAERLAPAVLDGAGVVAVAGLADPSSFEHTLARLGARVLAMHRLADHAGLAPAGWAEVEREAQRLGARYVVLTRKDAVKHPACAGPAPAIARPGAAGVPLAVLDVAHALVAGQDALVAAVDRALAAGAARRAPPG